MINIIMINADSKDGCNNMITNQIITKIYDYVCFPIITIYEECLMNVFQFRSS